MLKELLNSVWVPLFGGGLAGFVVRAWWEARLKTSEWLVARQTLVERQLEGGLGRTGQRRLGKSLVGTVDDLAGRMGSGVEQGTTRVWRPEDGSVVVVRPSGARGRTLCPDGGGGLSEDGRKAERVLYLGLDRPPSGGHGESGQHVAYGVPTQFGKAANGNERAFLSLPRDGPDRSAWLWVDASALRWASAEAAMECLARTRQQVAKEYPRLDVVLEINAARDVVGEFDGRCRTSDAVQEEAELASDLPELQYVDARDAVYESVAGGRALWGDGDRGGPHLVVPAHILERRSAGLRRALAGDWKSLTVRGPAGVGKTQTVRQVVEWLCNERRAIAVELSASDLADMHRRGRRARMRMSRGRWQRCSSGD